MKKHDFFDVNWNQFLDSFGNIGNKPLSLFIKTFSPCYYSILYVTPNTEFSTIIKNEIEKSLKEGSNTFPLKYLMYVRKAEEMEIVVTRPSKLNGTPDYRYNPKYSTHKVEHDKYFLALKFKEKGLSSAMISKNLFYADDKQKNTTFKLMCKEEFFGLIQKADFVVNKIIDEIKKINQREQVFHSLSALILNNNSTNHAKIKSIDTAKKKMHDDIMVFCQCIKKHIGELTIIHKKAIGIRENLLKEFENENKKVKDKKIYEDHLKQIEMINQYIYNSDKFQ